MSNTPTLRLLSLGAGRQSTTIAILAAEGAIGPLDGAIFADTGDEPDAVYENLDRLERDVLKPAGIPLHRVSEGHLAADALNPNKNRNIPAYTASDWYETRDPIGYGPCDCDWARAWGTIEGTLAEADGVIPQHLLDALPADCANCDNSGLVANRWGPVYRKRDLGMQKRRCTQLYKLVPILRQTRLLLGARAGEPKECRFCRGTGERVAPWRAKAGEFIAGPCSVCDGEGEIGRVGQPPAGLWAETLIGFSTDEIERVSNRGDTRYSKSRYPLLDLGMSLTQCESFLLSRGWMTPQRPVVKSACKMCPFHGNAAWRRIREQDPKSWRDAVEFDRAYRTGPGMRHERFLHISRVPLDQAPIERVRPSEWQQGTVMDAIYDAQLAEDGDPDGCSPWACRSGSPVSPVPVAWRDLPAIIDARYAATTEGGAR